MRSKLIALAVLMVVITLVIWFTLQLMIAMTQVGV
jgi:hypothetical protein